MTMLPSSALSVILVGILLFQMATVCAQTGSAADANFADSTGHNAEFELDIVMDKDEFKAGEAIRFTVEGNQDYYLYIFAENVVSGKKTMLLPNIKQTYNAFPANTPFIVPDSTVAFSVDSPGTTVLTAVATRNYVPIDSTAWEVEGDFYTGDIDLFESMLVGKGLVLNDAVEETEQGRPVFKQQELTIVNADPHPLAALPDSKDNPLVMVSSSCAVCPVGQPMKLGFSADRDGQFVLILVEPDGQQITLVNEHIVADQVRYITAMPGFPLGEHVLVALYGAAAEDVSSAVDKVVKTRIGLVEQEPIEKGLRIFEEPEALLPYSIRQLLIVE